MTERNPTPRRGVPRSPRAEPRPPISPTWEGTGILLSPDWLRVRGWPEGAPIDLEGLPDGSVLLRPARSLPSERRASIRVLPDRPGEHLFRELVAAYLGGATELQVEEPGGISRGSRQIVRMFAERIGAAADEGGRTESVPLDGPAGSSDTAVGTLLHRMYESVHALQEQAGQLLDARGTGDAGGIERKDDAIDRWAWQVERRSATAHEEDPVEIVHSVLIARALERIGDHAVGLAEHAGRLSECSVPAPVRATLKACHRQALDFLERAFAVTELPDRDRANELLDTGAALHAAHRSLTEGLLLRSAPVELGPIASVDLGLVLQSIDRTIAYSEDLAEIGLDRAVRTGHAPGGAARRRTATARTSGLPAR